MTDDARPDESGFEPRPTPTPKDEAVAPEGGPEGARLREDAPDEAEADPFAAIHARPGKPTAWPPSAGQRGLSSPYPPGGQDPEPQAGRREERFYLQLLVGMVLLIVLGGFALAIVGILLGIGGAEGVH